MPINNDKKASEKPITWRNLDDYPHIRQAIIDIINSAELSKNELDRYTGRNLDDDERVIRVCGILTYQYPRELSELLAKKDKSDVIGFLNRFAHSYCEFVDAGRPEYAPISPEELDKFRKLAAETDKIPKEQLSETAPILTVNSYLKMCRIVYDAATLWKYPDDISTEFLLSKARLMNSVFYGIDRDSPEEFARSYYTRYHHEELWFGSPDLNITDESARSGPGYTMPKIFGKWTGSVYCNGFSHTDLFRGVKMYIALRENGYPVYCSNYKKIYNEIIKFDYLRK